MKKLISLALLCSVLIPTSAMALKDGAPKCVLVGNRPAGFLTPYFRQQHPGACEYLASWDTQDGLDSGICTLIELRSTPYQSCSLNLLDDIDTFVQSSHCWGVDMRDRVVEVDILVAGESKDGKLTGTVMFAHLPKGPYSFKAENI